MDDLNPNLYYRITDLLAAGDITGEEVVEAVQNGKNVKFTTAQLLSAGKSAYQVALDNGFVGTQAQWLTSLKGIRGIDGVMGVDGRSAFQIAVDNGYAGTEPEFIASITGEFAIGGAVFVTAVTPQSVSDNVSEFVYAADDISIETCSSTTNNVTVKVLALTGYSKYRPTVTVNGLPIVLTAKPDAPLFEGTINITLPVSGQIDVVHEDGAKWRTVVAMDAPPVVTSAIFTGGYPLGQSELKAGDALSIKLTTDVDVVGYEIENSNAFVAATGTIAAGKAATITGLLIADRGIATSILGFRVRVKKANGAFSAWYNSTTGGGVDGVNTVKLNNLYPNITYTTTDYPVGQSALSGVQEATVNHTITNFDTVAYSSSELAITTPAIYTPAKKVSRASGGYNTTVKNFTVTATRAANKAVTVQGTIVAIADAVPTITVATPAVRLRSGGNAGTAAQNHVITLTSNQALIESPTLNAPEGTWVEAAFTGNAAKTIWTRTLRIHDDNAKGTFTFNSLSAKGLSNVVQNTLSGNKDYVLGGFVFRTITIPAFPVRAISFGTNITDTAKLRCTNLSKGNTGTLNYTYQNTLAEAVNKFTVTVDGVVSSVGNTWYNADGLNASSNTGGTMKIEIEEVV